MRCNGVFPTAYQFEYRDGESLGDFLDDSIGAGVLDAITITADNGVGVAGLDISWTTGEVRDFDGDIHETTASSAQTCTDNAINYLVWDTTNNVLSLGTSSPAANVDVEIGRIACQDGVVWMIHHDSVVKLLLTDIVHGLEEVHPLVVTEGLSVTDDGDSDLDVVSAAGEFYHDLHTEHVCAELNSSTSEAMHLWYHVSGVWDTAHQTTVPNDQYDDGTDLVNLTVNKWVKALFMRSVADIHFIYPDQQYNTEAQALAGSLPAIPPGLAMFPQVTAVVFQEGETDISNATFLDIRPTAGGSGGSIASSTPNAHVYINVTSNTIATGAITVTGDYIHRFATVDTEGAAASDDLDTINGGSVGETITIQAANDARTVVVKDGTNLKLQADFSLNNTTDKIKLECISSGVWHEISRSSSDS